MGHGGEFWQNVVHWRREWQTTSVFLPWEPHERCEKGTTLVDELPWLVGAQCATGEQRRNNSRKNEEAAGGGGLVAKSCPILVTPWTVALQVPLSMGFSRQEYWSWLPFPSPIQVNAQSLMFGNTQISIWVQFFRCMTHPSVSKYGHVFAPPSNYTNSIITLLDVMNLGCHATQNWKMDYVALYLGSGKARRH